MNIKNLLTGLSSIGGIAAVAFSMAALLPSTAMAQPNKDCLNNGNGTVEHGLIINSFSINPPTRIRCHAPLGSRWVNHPVRDGHVERGQPATYVRGPDWSGPIRRQNNSTSRGHFCAAGRPASACGSVALTTGTSRCVGGIVTAGFTFELPSPLSAIGFGINGSGTWSNCTNRSETISCQGRPGRTVRAAVQSTSRDGQVYYIQRAEGPLVFSNGNPRTNGAIVPGYAGPHLDRIRRFTRDYPRSVETQCIG